MGLMVICCGMAVKGFALLGGSVSWVKEQVVKDR